MPTASSASLPSVDILISSYQEQEHIARCLEHVLEQDYPRELIRICLVDGGSSDDTVEIARRLADRDGRLEVIADGHRRNLPEALNVGLERCSGDLVAKVDAHGFPDRDFVARAVEAFASGGEQVACVGGRPEQEGDNPFGRAVALARGSRFGVGGSVYAGKSDYELVDTVQCGVYRRSALDAVGRFDGSMNYGEDEEVNWRLRKAGHEILLDGRIRFHYVPRSSWRALWRQYRNYGEARVRVVEAHPDFLRPRHLVPGAFVAGLATLAATAPFARIARRCLAAMLITYAGGASSAAVQSTRADDRALAPLVAACFVALHLGYGAGMAKGLMRRLAPRRRAN